MKTLLRHLTAAALFCALATAALAQTPRVIEFANASMVGNELWWVSFGITVTPPLAQGEKVQVRLKVTDGTARRGEDFTLPSDNFLLTLKHGSSDSVPAGMSLGNWETGRLWVRSIRAVDDGIREPDETFTLTLSEPGPGAVLGERASLTATIQNSPPTLFISVRGNSLSLEWPAPYDNYGWRSRGRASSVRTWPSAIRWSLWWHAVGIGRVP